jgi:hypothetical protein
MVRASMGSPERARRTVIGSIMHDCMNVYKHNMPS